MEKAKPKEKAKTSNTDLNGKGSIGSLSVLLFRAQESVRIGFVGEPGALVGDRWIVKFKDYVAMRMYLSVLVYLGLVSSTLADDNRTLEISPLVSGQNLVGSFTSYQVGLDGEVGSRDDWVLRRSATRIVYQRDKVSDVWEKNGLGEIVYTQVYHDFKTYIEYFPADFRLLEQAEPEWQQLGSLFDLDALNTLSETGRYHVSEQPVIIYTGNLQGLGVTVHWLAGLDLPLRIEYQRQDFSQIMELQSLYGSEDSPWPQWRQADYFGMDFVDMGDNESHPLVQALNAGQAGGHRH